MTLGGSLAFADVATGAKGPFRIDGFTVAAEPRPLPFYDPQRLRVRAVL